MIAAARTSSLPQDLLALTKPRITRMVVFTTAVGMWMAPAGSLSVGTVLWTLLGSVLIVSAANVLNMYLERDVDALMARTASRPLPAGRLPPSTALAFGIALACVAIPVLTFLVNPITALLALVAFGTYVGLYTPLKQKSWTAVLVGAVPGAIPPMMGWTAATGSVSAPAVALFAILFVWQIPHTLAITLFRHEEYLRAGFQTLPVQHGERFARFQTALYAPVLVAASLAPATLHLAGMPYVVTALVLGAGFVLVSWLGLRERGETRWAKGIFVYSLFYLVGIFGVLLATAGHGGV